MSNSELVQGTLETLVRKTLALESMDGYGIALHRADQQRRVPRESGLTASGAQPNGAGRANSRRMAFERKQPEAKYYALTAAGRKALEQERRQWGRQIAAIDRILEA